MRRLLLPQPPTGTMVARHCAAAAGLKPRNRLKAQAEMLILAGVIVLVVVAVLFSVQTFVSSPVPQGVAQAQKEVKESFLSLARDAAAQTIIAMEAHGGYLPASAVAGSVPYSIPQHVVYGGRGVPYWTMCSADTSPSRENVTAWLETGIHLHLLKNLASMPPGTSFNTSQLRVKATIHDRKVDVAITLPTAVQGYPIQQPYALAVPTSFGRIVSFAKDFAREHAKNRQLDYFAIASVHFSRTLPTLGLLTDCGRAIYLSPDEVADGIDGAIRYTLSNTLWWQLMPVDFSQPKVYAIQSVSNRTYPDLAIRFGLPDDFRVQGMAPVLITNDDLFLDSLYVFVVPECVGPYNQRYQFAYPAIVSVEDPSLGSDFSMASLVHAREQPGDGSMEPGDCSPQTSFPTACSSQSLACTASLTVQDATGTPLPGTVAIFGGCQIGVADAGGRIEGAMVCGTHNLSLFHSAAYTSLKQVADPSVINGTYTLRPLSNTTFSFREVTIATGQGYTRCDVSPPPAGSNKFTMVNFTSPTARSVISNIDPDSLPNISDPSVCQSNPSRCATFTVLSSRTVPYLPADTYTVDSELRDPGDSMKIIGTFLGSATIPPTPATLFLHVPRTVSGYSFTAAEKQAEAAALQSRCSLNPISTVAAPSRIYTIPSDCCTGLRNAVMDVGSCADQSLLGQFTPLGLTGQYACSPTPIIQAIEAQCSVKIEGVC